jgi:transposase
VSAHRIVAEGSLELACKQLAGACEDDQGDEGLAEARTPHRVEADAQRVRTDLRQAASIQSRRVSLRRLREPDAIELLKRRGVPEVWRDSIQQRLTRIDELDRRINPIDRELGPIVRSDLRARLLQTITGVGPLIGLTLAAEVGDVSRFSSPSKLVGYAGQAWRRSNPFHHRYRRIASRHGKNPAKSAVARKLLIG